jgi:hypothetical protein
MVLFVLNKQRNEDKLGRVVRFRMRCQSKTMYHTVSLLVHSYERTMDGCGWWVVHVSKFKVEPPACVGRRQTKRTPIWPVLHLSLNLIGSEGTSQAYTWKKRKFGPWISHDLKSTVLFLKSTGISSLYSTRIAMVETSKIVA